MRPLCDLLDLPQERDDLLARDVRHFRVRIVSRPLDHQRRPMGTLGHQRRLFRRIGEIGIARSYGDLRENFEFKAAKQMQAVLMRRKTELE